MEVNITTITILGYLAFTKKINSKKKLPFKKFLILL